MLFRRDDLVAIASGEITLAFRRWRRPTVKAGGTLHTAAGLLAIESVEPIDPARISAADARRAGFADPGAARAALRGEGQTYRIAFHVAGPDPRIALRADAALDADGRAPRSRRGCGGSTPPPSTARGPPRRCARSRTRPGCAPPISPRGSGASGCRSRPTCASSRRLG